MKRSFSLAITQFRLQLLLMMLAFFFCRPVLCSTIGNHPAVYDEHGTLMPWTNWGDAVDREMNW